MAITDKKEKKTKLPETLRSLYINPTKYCNLSCKHCWVSPPVKDQLTSDNSEISMEEIINIIKEAKGLGLDTVKLTGGEPLLRRDIDQLLKYCCDKGLRVDIETNGSLITKDVAIMIAKYKVNFVGISLDSYKEEVHDFLRGKSGAFKSTIEGIKYLSSEHSSPQIILSLYKDNADEIDKFLKLMEELGVTDVKINVISPVGRAAVMAKMGETFTMEEVLIFSRRLDEIRKTFSGRIYLDIPVAFKSLDDIGKSGCGTCRIKNILGLLSDGSVSICGIGYLQEDLVFGNVRKNPELLKEIWQQNKKLEQIKRELPEKLEGICGMCTFKYICLGNCRAEVYNTTGSLFAPYWFCQEAYDKGIFPDIRIIPEALQKII